MRRFAKKSCGLLLLVIMAALLMALPVAAQSSNDPQKLMVVEGLYTVTEDGIIKVGDYIIAPADAFLPPDIADGDSVSVTGYLLPDGETIQALSIEIEQDTTLTDATTPPTSDQTGDDASGGQGNGHGHGHGHGDDDAGGQGNGDSNGQGDGGQGNGHGHGHGHGDDNGGGQGNGHGHGQGNGPEHSFFCQHNDKHHPAAERIADEFGVDYSEVISLFCDGKYGFGQILIAYRLAKVSGQSVPAILALRDSGEGWGTIFHDLDVNPGDVMGHGASKGD